MNRKAALKTAVGDLWSDDAETRCRAAADLYKWVSEMADIRAAQPALTMCLGHPDASVRQSALRTVEYRAELGADIGMAVPALEALLDDPEEEIQETAWRTLQFADKRMKGIVEVVELCRPSFLFERSTRTTICPSMGPGYSPDVNPLTGAWGPEPFASEQARTFFGRMFSGTDVNKRIEEAFSDPAGFNAIRAAAYFLEVFGIARVWPGDLKELQQHIERGLFLLKSMIDTTIGDPDSEFLERWNNDNDVIIAVEKQINALTERLIALRNK